MWLYNLGMICGNHLLSKLSETSVHGCGPGSGPDKGVMGLLQSNPVSMDLHTFLFDRDSSKMLSPIPTKRFVSEKQFFRDITSNTYVYPFVFSEFCAMLFSYTQSIDVSFIRILK